MYVYIDMYVYIVIIHVYIKDFIFLNLHDEIKAENTKIGDQFFREKNDQKVPWFISLSPESNEG